MRLNKYSISIISTFGLIFLFSICLLFFLYSEVSREKYEEIKTIYKLSDYETKKHIELALEDWKITNKEYIKIKRVFRYQDYRKEIFNFK
jgi:cbb3-type cytochrome oxidase subunit 3